MGILDSESEQSNAQGESGAQTQTGPAVSLGLNAGDGIKHNTIITNVTETDFDSIELAFDLADDTIGLLEDISSDNVKSVDAAFDAVENQSDNNSDDYQAGLDYGEALADEAFYSARFAIDSGNDLAKDLARETAGIASEAMQALVSSNDDNVRLFEKLSSDQVDLFGDFAETQGEFFTDSLDSYRELSTDAGELIVDLMSEANSTNSENLESIKDFAETTATDGQNMFIDLLKWLGIALFISLAVIFVAVSLR